MTRTELQSLIDHADSAAEMLRIGRAYLEGRVLYDRVAAEAWLLKAVETEDPLLSPQAMYLLAEQILKVPVLTDADRQDIAADLKTAAADKKPALNALLKRAN